MATLRGACQPRSLPAQIRCHVALVVERWDYTHAGTLVVLTTLTHSSQSSLRSNVIPDLKDAALREAAFRLKFFCSEALQHHE